MAGQPAGKVLRIVQITDTHLYGKPDARLLELNTRESLDRVLDLVSEREATFDMVLATGDIAQDASEEAYHHFADAIQRFGRPFYWIPGNHDRASVMRRLERHAAALEKRIRLGNWQILMLDSSVPGEVHGRLKSSELEWLERMLIEAEADDTVQHSLVCLHHNPHPGTADWMQGIGLHEAERLLDVLGRHASVRAVLYGHIHQELDFEHNGIRYLCSPSTCIQFKPGVVDFTLDDRAPAYRWLELGADGSIDSAVERVPDYDLEVDFNSEGY